MSLPTPFYEQDGITIYCGDNRRIVPLLDEFDLLLTEPPYGIGADKNQASRANKQHGAALAPSRDYGRSDWDMSPPSDWFLQSCLAGACWQIIWGGNYFRLPPSSCWLVWDKENGDNGYADCELAWTNLPKAVRRIRHLWNGMIRKGQEEGFHPTQKPLDVMSWCLSHAPEAKSALDPWMGSGTTLVAAKLRGLKAVGIEINEQYCETAVRRLAQGVLLPV